MKEISDKYELQEIGIQKLSDRCLLMSEIRKLSEGHDDRNHDPIIQPVIICLFFCSSLIYEIDNICK